MFKDGQRIAYVAEEPEKGFKIGDEGKIIAVAGSGAHVQWTSGKHAGEITLTRIDDLTPLKKQPRAFQDADGLLVTIAVRDVYASGGEAGLLNAMNDEGHMANWEAYAEEAIQLISGRIRSDPLMQEVLAQLEAEEGEELVATATMALLRDAFSVGAE